MSDQAWGSHLVPLMASLLATNGPVLEVGVGYWSTPMLDGFCKAAGRPFVRVENAPEWAQNFPGTAISGDYSILTGLAVQQWSVVFLDHSPGWRRAADALLFRHTAEIIVVHDWSSTEISDPFQPILGNWKYSKTYNRYAPATLLLSNTMEIPL